LNGLKSRYESHHGIKYTTAAIQATAELASRYINDRFLPDKALDILDEFGAAFRLSETTKKRKNVTVRDVESVLSRLARIPAKSCSRSEIRTI